MEEIKYAFASGCLSLLVSCAKEGQGLSTIEGSISSSNFATNSKSTFTILLLDLRQRMNSPYAVPDLDNSYFYAVVLEAT